METICVDNEHYDPFFILQVSKKNMTIKNKKQFENNLRNIYKKQSLKYHPDKNNGNELKFRIINESYKYILNKLSYLEEYKLQECLKQTKESIDDYNKLNDIRETELKKNFLKEKQKEREEKFDVLNQFKNKKFSNEEFNKIFEYIKKENKEEEQIEETIDGFNGYNQDISQPLISSYNGLMITYDNMITQTNERSNFNKNFNYNPDKLINVKEIPEKKPVEYKKEKREETINVNIDIKEAEQNLYSKIYDKLKRKEEEDRLNVLNNVDKLYNKEVVNDCVNNKLQTNRTFLDVFDEHFYSRRITK